MSLPALSHLTVTTEDEDRIALLRFDHGKANEMGSAQLDDLQRLVEALGDPAGPRVLISYAARRTARGTPVFISGADVGERVGWHDDDVKAHVRRQRKILAGLREAPVLHVAVVNGVALGWGTEYLLCADYRIACDEAVFGLPETGLGIIPGAGGTSELWAHIGVAQALRLGMTGERIDAAEALRIGLVQERVVDVDTGLARARALGAGAARRSPTAVAAFKRGVLAAVGRPPGLRIEEEARAYEHCVDTGEAAIGRTHFQAIRDGAEVPWGPRRPWHPLT